MATLTPPRPAAGRRGADRGAPASARPLTPDEEEPTW
ncbi:hypothetical protein J2S55_004260 [Streptosporangium brasiliense]|uniref:Uncharacterized protein n=1 Tax=Streptosporangium brasiliense TaxID=47480 RepID=A0ABT9R853_9ACTN|nr:hypothetical protein [Streptosporangium brasiliense]